jgi:hypothetical protein
MTTSLKELVVSRGGDEMSYKCAKCPMCAFVCFSCAHVVVSEPN